MNPYIIISKARSTVKIRLEPKLSLQWKLLTVRILKIEFPTPPKRANHTTLCAVHETLSKKDCTGGRDGIDYQSPLAVYNLPAELQNYRMYFKAYRSVWPRMDPVSTSGVCTHKRIILIRFSVYISNVLISKWLTYLQFIVAE